MKNTKIYLTGLITFIIAIIIILTFIKKNPNLTSKKNNSEIMNSDITKNSPPDADKKFASGKQKTTADTSINIKYLTGKFNPGKDSLFTKVDLKYANREDIYLRKETYKAFIKMYDAALKQGVKLKIISGTRNFYYQKYIWERKWTGKRLVNGKNLAISVSDHVKRAKTILKYSSMPGTSRHHWGTDIDINSLKNNYFATEKGKKIFVWLKNNAAQYGFCQTYTTKDSLRPTGYEEEKWHWSYMPLSVLLLEKYKKQVTYKDLKGFLGCETAEKLNVIDNYVMTINKECCKD